MRKNCLHEKSHRFPPIFHFSTHHSSSSSSSRVSNSNPNSTLPAMKLVVKVIEARNLPAMDLNGLSDPYVRLQLGRNKVRTKVVKKCLSPYYGDEFSFRVDDLSDELVVSVMDEDKYFADDCIGQVRVPVARVFDAEGKSLGTAWYGLLPKSKKSKHKDCVQSLPACFQNVIQT